MMQETYITADAYDGILEKLETLVRTFDETAPDDLRTRLIIILGEDGGMWPSSCHGGLGIQDKKPRLQTSLS